MKVRSLSKTLFLTAKARPSIRTTPITKDSGLTENIMGRESSFGLMDLSMKENISKERNMELELLPTLLKRFIKGNGSLGDSQDWDSSTIRKDRSSRKGCGGMALIKARRLRVDRRSYKKELWRGKSRG
jgi:hypothetical protein